MQAALSVCSVEVSEARNGQKRVENKRTQRFALARVKTGEAKFTAIHVALRHLIKYL